MAHLPPAFQVFSESSLMEQLQTELYDEGVLDGYEGNPAKHLDITYLKGYSEGAQMGVLQALGQSLAQEAQEQPESDLYHDGWADGYQNKKPTHVQSNFYLQGYAEGTRSKLGEVQAELDLLISR